MNKIICDVCGTTYPETASQCPICGCAKPETAQTVSGDAAAGEAAAAGTYTYVKGGRFSKGNVRKRNRTGAVPVVQKKRPAPVEPELKPELEQEHEQEKLPEQKKESSNTPLIIIAIFLVLAIIAMLLYIYFSYFAPQKPDNDTGKHEPVFTTTEAPGTPSTQTQPVQTVPSTQTEPKEIKCTGITLAQSQISLYAVGNAWLLNVTCVPADTTDTVTYSSSDPKVATVTAEGRVTAVGPGTAVITVTCGDVTETCSVTCNIQTEPTTAPTTQPTTAPEKKEELKLNREDFTLFAPGETWTLYRGDISLTQITWSSDNEEVVTFDKGVVTAVGPGRTYVHAEYNGTKVSCIVHCTFKTADDPTTETPQPGQESTKPAAPKYKFNSNYANQYGEVTIEVGKSFPLKLINSATGETVTVTWTASKAGICNINGTTITGLTSGSTVVSCTYEGVTYSCKVYVKNA